MSLIPALPILLRTNQRDIRITRHTLPKLGFSPITGAMQFAQNLLKRFTGCGSLEPYTPLVFRNTRIGIAVQYQNQQLHAHLHTHLQTNMQTQMQTQITPRLSMAVLAWYAYAEHPDQPVQIQPALHLPHLRVFSESQLIKTILIKKENNTLEQLVNQIMVQKKRVEIHPDDTLAQPSVALPPAPKHVFRHAEAISPDPAVITRVVEKKIAEMFHESKSNRLIQGTSQTPVDIHILADQVIRQIDQRIIAQRERLGKV